MNTKNLVLGIFAILTVLFASLTVIEYHQVNDLSSQLQSQSTNAVLTTVACPASKTCAAFTSSPNSELRVDSVEANLTSASGNVAFWVTFENTDGSPIHFWSYGLNFSVPANSSVLRKVLCAQCFPGGTDISSDIILKPGRSYTMQAIFPNTKDFYYQQVHAGIVKVIFDLTWRAETGTSCAGGPCTTEMTLSKTTTISAQFVFP
jgi:hypothetical protein